MECSNPIANANQGFEAGNDKARPDNALTDLEPGQDEVTAMAAQPLHFVPVRREERRSESSSLLVNDALASPQSSAIGLSACEAQRRLSEDGANVVERAKHVPCRPPFFDQHVGA